MSFLIWRGANVTAAVKRASITGINKTMGECVVTAKETVHVRSHTLQGSIRLEGARDTGGRIVGQWGSFDVNYALWQEVSMRHGGKPYLRPSADSNYPHLAGHIKASYA